MEKSRPFAEVGSMLLARPLAATLCGWAVLVSSVEAENPEAERGKKALLGHNFIPATISLQAYENVWRQWSPDIAKAPANFAEAFQERYGLHAAPYPNQGYPM